MTGEELFAKYGQDVLGPWEDQDPDVQRAWEEIAVGVTTELAKPVSGRVLNELLGEPPFEERN